jgi:hypothetical protein
MRRSGRRPGPARPGPEEMTAFYARHDQVMVEEWAASTAWMPCTHTQRSGGGRRRSMSGAVPGHGGGAASPLVGTG